MFTQKGEKAIEHYKCVIQAGNVVFSAEPSYICAVCGNGVLVTIYDPVHKVGGMAHCIYPNRKASQKLTNFHSDVAIASLYKKVKPRKGATRSIEAQLFGAGSLNGMRSKRAGQLLSDARGNLEQLKVRIVSEDIGGSVGRKVVFNTGSGEVMVLKTKKVRRSDWVPEFPRQNSRNKR